MAKEGTKPFTSDDVIAALLTFLPDKFSNDPSKIHRKIAELQKRNEYKGLLEDFEFIDYYPYPYSPLLGRILNRLQESRLLSSLNPDYEVYVMEPVSKDAIRSSILEKKLSGQRGELEQMASELNGVLKC